MKKSKSDPKARGSLARELFPTLCPNCGYDIFDCGKLEDTKRGYIVCAPPKPPKIASHPTYVLLRKLGEGS